MGSCRTGRGDSVPVETRHAPTSAIRTMALAPRGGCVRLDPAASRHAAGARSFCTAWGCSRGVRCSSGTLPPAPGKGGVRQRL